MRIGELAARTGVSVRALRYYEEQQLLLAERSPRGQRHYPELAQGRVNLIQELYRAGLSSQTIRKLLPCVDATGQLDQPHSHDLLLRERDRVDAQIRSLSRTRDTLDAVIDAAGNCAALRQTSRWDNTVPA